jgi:hypothetical protein
MTGGPPPRTGLRRTRTRRQDPLRELAGEIIADLRAQGFIDLYYDQIERLVRNHHRFIQCRNGSKLFPRYGLNGPIRSALQGFTFLSGPYASIRGLHALPIVGMSPRPYRFADAMSIADWTLLQAYAAGRVRAFSIKSADIATILTDLRRRQAQLGIPVTLATAYPQVRIGLR